MSDKQSIMFDANLSPNAIANRNVLSNTFSLTIKNQTLKIAEKLKNDSDEAIRIVEDALSCVTNMEFLGQKSKKFISNPDIDDPRNNSFCSMPIKFDFEDGGARVHFE